MLHKKVLNISAANQKCTIAWGVSINLSPEKNQASPKITYKWLFMDVTRSTILFLIVQILQLIKMFNYPGWIFC